MITWLEEKGRADYLAVCDTDPVIGARMHTALGVYGLGSAISEGWLARDGEGRPTAALLRFDGWMVIAATGGADIPELAEFLRAAGGFGTIEGSPALCRELTRWFPGVYASADTMAYLGEPFPDAPGMVKGNPPLRDIYDLICRGSPFMAEHARWDSWYPHTSHLVRHGLGFGAVVYADGRPVATGGVYTASPRYGVIGSLTTLPGWRGRGYAAAITKYLCNRLLERGQTPALYCAEDSLAAYYGRLGFTPLGKWAEISLEDR